MKKLPQTNFFIGDNVKSKNPNDINTYTIEDFVYSMNYNDWFVEYSYYNDVEDQNILTKDFNYFVKNMIKIS